MTDTDTTSTIDETAAAQAQQGVGLLLRETRIKAGLEIAEVARVLRISQRYLEALEDGRNAELPGSTYAIGFVRSYSEYLKLDGEEIVRRFKAEAQGNGVKSALIFPKPIPDSGVPGAAVLGLGVIVAAVAYGVWYWNSNADDVTIVRVEPVPEQIAAPAENTAPAASQDSASEAQAVPATAAAGAPAMEPAVEQANEATVDAQTASDAVTPSATQAVGVAPVVVEPPAEDASATEQPVTEQPETEPAEAATTEPEPTAEAVAEPVAETAAEPAASAEPVAAAVEPASSSSPASVPTVSGEDGLSRITVRATANSWIQIRDEALDRLLFTRLLREGDLYEVPNRAGLSLMTGNAGALELVVDGTVIPAIGQIGEVRRNVELDPEKLKAGTAVTE